MKNKEVKYLKNTKKHFYLKLVITNIKFIILSGLFLYIAKDLEDAYCTTNSEEIVNTTIICLGFVYSFLIIGKIIRYTTILNYKALILENNIKIKINKKFSSKKQVFKYKNLQHVALTQSPLEKLFKLKTVIAYTPSGQNHNLKINNIDEEIADDLFLFLENIILREHINEEL